VNFAIKFFSFFTNYYFTISFIFSFYSVSFFIYSKKIVIYYELFTVKFSSIFIMAIDVWMIYNDVLVVYVRNAYLTTVGYLTMINIILCLNYSVFYLVGLFASIYFPFSFLVLADYLHIRFILFEISISFQRS
jgi:hypothetical protein